MRRKVRTYNTLPCFLFCCTLNSGSLSAGQHCARSIRSATSPEPEWIGHAGVALQHDWNTREATRFQHVLICVRGGTSPRFTQISLLLLLLLHAPSHAHWPCTSTALAEFRVPSCRLVIMSPAVASRSFTSRPVLLPGHCCSRCFEKQILCFVFGFAR